MRYVSSHERKWCRGIAAIIGFALLGALGMIVIGFAADSVNVAKLERERGEREADRRSHPVPAPHFRDVTR